MMPGMMDQQALLRAFFQNGGQIPQGAQGAGAGVGPGFAMDHAAMDGVQMPPPGGGAMPLPPGNGGSAGPLQPFNPMSGGGAVPLGAEPLPPVSPMMRGGGQQLPPAPRGPGGGAQQIPLAPAGGRMPAEMAHGVGGGGGRSMGGPQSQYGAMRDQIGPGTMSEGDFADQGPEQEEKKRRLIEAIMRASAGR